MPNPLRRQIREAAATALTGLTTTAGRVYQSRTHELQDTELPGLRIYLGELAVEESLDNSPIEDQILQLIVEACSKKSSNLDDELDEMEREVRVALHTNQTIGGAQYVRFLGSAEPELSGEAEKEIGVMRMTFEVMFYSARGAPDVAL